MTESDKGALIARLFRDIGEIKETEKIKVKEINDKWLTMRELVKNNGPSNGEGIVRSCKNRPWPSYEEMEPLAEEISQCRGRIDAIKSSLHISEYRLMPLGATESMPYTLTVCLMIP